MKKLAILIPVLRRPQNISPLVSSINRSTQQPFEILFIASPSDSNEIKELENQNQKYIVMDANYENNGDYARKINKGFDSIEAEWYFSGADDIRFHPGWFGAAMQVYEKTEACVIGTNDLGSPSVMRGQHSTHSLVLREYVRECGTIDQPGKVLHEGYRHNFVDTEFVATAKCRDEWAFAMNSRVEHLHPDWQKGQRDPIYAIGKLGWNQDQRYFEMRKRLWT